MYARNTFASLALLGLLVTSAAAAPAIGPAKARGDYRPGAWQVQRSGSYDRSYSRSAVPAGTVQHAYTAPTAPAPAVAQAPSEVRRFSYAPQTSAAGATPVVANPCPQVAPSESGRRYSYAPAPEVHSAPAVDAYQPHYGTSGRVRSGGSRELWALPKTDPRKYSSR